MAESRADARVAAKHRGIAVIGGRQIDCMIRDLSAHGARLNFNNPTILPRQFRLQFDEHDQRVTVVWQSRLLVGVRFHSPIRHAVAPNKRVWQRLRR